MTKPIKNDYTRGGEGGGTAAESEAVTPKAAGTLDPNQTYRPIMLHMKCRGSLSFPSTKKYPNEPNYKKASSSSLLKSSSSVVTCHGIQSRIQPVKEYPPMKPHQALRVFTNQTSFYHPDHYDDDDDDTTNNVHTGNSQSRHGFGGAGGRGGGKSQKILKSNEGMKLQHHVPLLVDPKWDQLKKELSQRSDVDLSNMNNISSLNTADDNSNTNGGNKMNFFGSTDIYLLVLRPNHHENGDNHTTTNKNDGISQLQYRATIKTNYNNNQNRKKNVPKSPFELPLEPYPDRRTPSFNSRNDNDDNDNASSSSFTKDKDKTIPSLNDENNTHDNNSKTEVAAAAQEQSIVYALTPINKIGISSRKVHDGKGLGCSSTTIKLGILEIQMASFEEEIEEEDDVQKGKNTTSSSNNIHTNTTQNQEQGTIFNGQFDEQSLSKTWEQTKTYYDKVEKISSKIQDHMVQNATHIKNELENDFLDRTMNASRKIVGNFGKTWTRMEKTASDLWKIIMDSDNNGDGSGGGSSSGRRGGTR